MNIPTNSPNHEPLPISRRSDLQVPLHQRKSHSLTSQHIEAEDEHKFWATLVDPYVVYAHAGRGILYSPSERKAYIISYQDSIVLGGYRGTQFRFRFRHGYLERSRVREPNPGPVKPVREEILLIRGLIYPEQFPSSSFTKYQWRYTIDAVEIPQALWWDSQRQQPWAQEVRFSKILRWKHSALILEITRGVLLPAEPFRETSEPSQQAMYTENKEQAVKDEAARNFPSVICRQFLLSLDRSVLLSLIRDKTRKRISASTSNTTLVALIIGLYDTAYEVYSKKCIPFNEVRAYARVGHRVCHKNWVILQAIWAANRHAESQPSSHRFRTECKKLVDQF